MVFDATFNNISVKSLPSVLVKEKGFKHIPTYCADKNTAITTYILHLIWPPHTRYFKLLNEETLD